MRDPIERIVSAYRNKFVKDYKSSKLFQKKFGIKIIKKYRKNNYKGDGNDVKFSEFVSYLIDTYGSGDVMNEHWTPIADLCHPCEVR